MKKVLLCVAFLVAIWLGGVVNKVVFTSNVGVVLLSNRSQNSIASAQVSVCGQTFTFLNIPKADFAAIRYAVTGDSHYEVKVSFQSGRMLDGEIGYVTSGADFFDVIEIMDEEFKYRNRALGQ